MAAAVATIFDADIFFVAVPPVLADLVGRL
jgi:hypothetical protein